MRESAGHEAAEQETEKHGSGVVGEERKDSAFGERPISGRCYNSESNFSISTRRYFATSLCPLYCCYKSAKKEEKETVQNKITSLRGVHKNRFSMLFLRDVKVSGSLVFL